MSDFETQTNGNEGGNGTSSLAPILIKAALVIGGIALAAPVLAWLVSALIGLAQAALVIGIFVVIFKVVGFYLKLYLRRW